MRPGLWLSFGTLAFLLVTGCSSRGGEGLFSGDTPHDGIDDGAAGAGGDEDSGEDGEGGQDGEGEVPDSGAESDAGDEDASDGATEGEGGLSELPSIQLACGSATCTTPGEYCCLPSGNVTVGTSPTCKASNSECKLGIGNWVSGIPQHCGAHEHCGGGQCCAIRENANQSYTSIKCEIRCEGAEVEVCDPKNPQCTTGSCKESNQLRGRGVFVCQP